jgi:hypothetical protein
MFVQVHHSSRVHATFSAPSVKMLFHLFLLFGIYLLRLLFSRLIFLLVCLRPHWEFLWVVCDLLNLMRYHFWIFRRYFLFLFPMLALKGFLLMDVDILNYFISSIIIEHMKIPGYRNHTHLFYLS